MQSTKQEQLNKFKQDFGPHPDYTLLVNVTGEDKFLGVVYKKVGILTKKYGKELAETYIAYIKVNTLEEFIKDLTPYITQRAHAVQSN